MPFVGDLARQLESEAPPQVLDVRLPAEWEAGRIPDSTNLPLQRLAEWVGTLDPAGSYVLQCQSGYRSSVAASLLEKHGFTRLQDLQGGWLAWAEAHAGSPG